MERIRTDAFTLVMTGQVSESALANAAGISQPHLSQFIHGKRQLSPASADNLSRAILRHSFPVAA